jgi:hypothetical protein
MLPISQPDEVASVRSFTDSSTTPAARSAVSKLRECWRLREKRDRSQTTMTSKGRGCPTMVASILLKAGAAFVFEAADAVVMEVADHQPALALGVQPTGVELGGDGEVAVGLLRRGAAGVEHSAQGAGHGFSPALTIWTTSGSTGSWPSVS